MIKLIGLFCLIFASSVYSSTQCDSFRNWNGLGQSYRTDVYKSASSGKFIGKLAGFAPGFTNSGGQIYQTMYLEEMEFVGGKKINCISIQMSYDQFSESMMIAGLGNYVGGVPIGIMLEARKMKIRQIEVTSNFLSRAVALNQRVMFRLTTMQTKYEQRVEVSSLAIIK